MPPWWTAEFGPTPPLGHRLRIAYPGRWLRIHSLPGSKRYPSDPAELELLLARHQALADELLGSGGRCWLLTPTWEPAPIGSRRQLAGCFGPREFECVGGEYDPETEIHAAYWALESSWQAAREREVLVAVANDEQRALWLADATHEIYAPYDGGADLILASPARRATLANRYAHWLSRRPDGL
jgi:hypothetical protein